MSPASRWAPPPASCAQALGAPESTVSIPGDDGHLLEICQYWAKGEPVGTIRLDNGRVVSVQSQQLAQRRSVRYLDYQFRSVSRALPLN